MVNSDRLKFGIKIKRRKNFFQPTTVLSFYFFHGTENHGGFLPHPLKLLIEVNSGNNVKSAASLCRQLGANVIKQCYGNFKPFSRVILDALSFTV
jgi:hypothetical protein